MFDARFSGSNTGGSAVFLPVRRPPLLTSFPSLRVGAGMIALVLRPLAVVCGALFFALLPSPANWLRAETPEKPNVIFIMADDLGYGDLGCFGQKEIATPKLDRMAQEGMRLTSFYAGNTVCRPSRLVLWTGRHTGNQPINDNKPYTFSGEEHTLAELMKAQGYVTGGVGKWAMGTPGSGGEPIYHGFDFWCGYLDQSEAHNYYPTHLWRCEGESIEKLPLEGNKLMDHPDARGRVADPAHRKTYSHDVMTDEAFDFIRRNQEKPFLLHIHWTIPHTNNEGGRVTGDGQEVPDYGPYADRDWPNAEKGFAAMITRMDADVGRLRELLAELNLTEKTLIVFTSDNGPHNEGGHKHTFFDSNGPLKGFKRTVYEGGIRVPTIVCWPGQVPAGTQSDTHFNAYDVMATYADLTGAQEVPPNDGLSFLPTILGQDHPEARERISYNSFQKMEAARQAHWKAVRKGPKQKVELYDLSEDIGEENNIAEEHPEVVERLTEFLDNM